MKFWRFIRVPLIITAITLTAAAIFLARNPEWLKVEAVQMEMQAGSQEAIIFQRIQDALKPKFQQLKGQYFWDVPLSRVHQIVTNDKRVKEFSIYREFPNKIRVEVTPHTPVMAYLSSDRRFYPVAKDATLLPALPTNEFPNLPILRGEELKDEPVLRAQAIELYEKLPSEGTLKRGTVSEIIYSKRDGFKVFLNSATGEIKLGDSDFGPKISRVQKVLTYLDSQNVKGRVIDARFSKKVVVRVRNSP